MSEAAIQKVVCMAVVSDRFRSQLLGEDRAEVLRLFGLENREQQALIEIHAETIEEFAAGVERLLHGWKRAEVCGRSLATAPLCRGMPIEVPPGRE